MDVIINSITADPNCVGYIILSLDGTIQESSNRLENRHDLALNIFGIFSKFLLQRETSKKFIFKGSLKDRPRARVMFHTTPNSEEGYQILAYQMNGKIGKSIILSKIKLIFFCMTFFEAKKLTLGGQMKKFRVLYF